MEVAASILIQTLAEFIPCCCYCICHDAKNSLNLESNLEDLDKEMKTLIDLRDQVQRQLESSEDNEDGKQETAKVEEWLQKVAKLEKNVNSTRERVAAGQKGRARMVYSEWKWKSGVSREVVGLLEEVKRLQKDGKFENLFQTKVDHQAKPST